MIIKARFLLNTIIFYFLLVFICASCNKYEISDQQADVFLKFFGSYQEDVGTDVRIDDDGGYVVVGTWTTTDKAKQMCLIKTDKYGNEMSWSPKFFGDTLDDYGYGLRILGDGYVLVGTSIDGNGEKNILMVRTDKQGNALNGFPKIFNMPGNEEGFDITESANDGFVIAGYGDNLPLGKGGREYYLLETDGAGDSIMARHFGFAGNEQFNCIEKIADGYLCLGQSDNFTGKGTYDLTLIEANNILYPLSPINFGTTKSDAGECLVVNADGSGVLCGTSTTADGTQSDIFLASFNSDLAITTIQVAKPSSGNFTGKSVVMTAEGNYVLVGSEMQADENIYLLGLDTGGNQMFYTTFGRTGSQTGNSVRITPDGGFIIAGSNAFEGNSMITLIKTGSEGSMD